MSIASVITDATSTPLTGTGRTQFLHPPGDLVPAPANLAEMIDSAERIAGDLDFIRVDLYNVGGEIYLGEAAAYPGGGLERHHRAICPGAGSLATPRR